ncbi:DUF1223 domain-containing protein [Rhodobacterales bacterium HKCCE4037]|nr:DUF1223 domain-containing protein [Rhodobacterales bacterium HKCCE4037]
MRRTSLMAVLASGLTVFPALADGPVVVELFTSQGCSSCPPADALLAELAGREDVIALALHVDYWDYIGWPDTFADPAYTARQNGYAHAAGSTVVYTPQMVIGGVDHVVGTRPMEVADRINAQRASDQPVTVEAEPTDGGWLVRAVWTESSGDMPRMVVQVVGYMPMQEVEITRGENAGLTTEYYNIVQSWRVAGEWSEPAPFETEVTAAGDMPHVVIVQASGFGEILGAARLD